jgi:hypothetical protein
MRRYAVILFALLALSGSAGAMLSSDSSAREPQIRAYRQQVRDTYEKRQIERQSQAVRAYEQTRADIFTPPWLRGGVQASLQSGTEGAPAAPAGNAPKRKHRFLASIVLLILIGAVTGWVRYTTREMDK